MIRREIQAALNNLHNKGQEAAVIVSFIEDAFNNIPPEEIDAMNSGEPLFADPAANDAQFVLNMAKRFEQAADILKSEMLKIAPALQKPKSPQL